MNIIDDTMFQKMAEDIGFCEEMISTVLMRQVVVISVTPQNSIKNLQGRSVVLDALCVFEDESEGGGEEMCEAVENYARECAEEAAKEVSKETAYNFFKNGASYEIVRASITSLSDEELQDIYKKACGA